MNIFARFYFRAARLEREKRENKCSAKISTFTVYPSLYLTQGVIFNSFHAADDSEQQTADQK